MVIKWDFFCFSSRAICESPLTTCRARRSRTRTISNGKSAFVSMCKTKQVKSAFFIHLRRECVCVRYGFMFDVYFFSLLVFVRIRSIEMFSSLWTNVWNCSSFYLKKLNKGRRSHKEVEFDIQTVSELIEDSDNDDESDGIDHDERLRRRAHERKGKN